MIAYWIGQLIGYLLVSIVIPVIVLMVFSLTPLKQKLAITHTICGSLGVILPLTALRGGYGPVVQVTLASCMSAILFFFSYRTEIKKMNRSPN
jgi:hypothetical protein